MCLHDVPYDLHTWDIIDPLLLEAKPTITCKIIAGQNEGSAKRSRNGVLFVCVCVRVMSSSGKSYIGKLD